MMGVDRTLRVVILPNALSTGPLIDLLRALVVQRLIDPPILLVDDSMNTRRLGVTSDDDEVKPLRHHVETARCQRFLLINLVTADAVVQTPETVVSQETPEASEGEAPVLPELQTAFQVDTFIRNALAFKFGENAVDVPQRIDVINLVVPAAKAKSMPTYLHTRGPAVAANVSGWSNVVIAPEIQSTSLQAVVPVTANEEYIAHVGAALVTVAGCWAGAVWEPDFPSWEPDRWTVVRGRSRSLVAPELPVRVLSRIGGSANRVPISDEVEYMVAPDPRHASSLALHQIIKRHHLTLRPFVNVEEKSAQQIISIRDFLHMLWAWVTGTLPSIVMNEALERIHSMGDRVDERINQRAGLNDESQFRIRFLGRKRKPRPVSPDEQPDDFTRQNWRFVAAEPAVWSTLRSLSFGLLDGGDIHDEEVTSLLGVGGRRYVLGEQRLISPPPDVPLWQPSEAIAALGIGPGLVRAVVDVQWAADWVEALESLIATLKSSIATEPGATAAQDEVAGTGISDEDLLDIAEGDLARLQSARTIARESLLWGLGEHLYDQYLAVQRFLANLREQKHEAEEEREDLAAIKEGGRKTKRRALVRLLVALAVLILVAVACYFAAKHLTLSGEAIIVAAIIVALFWFVALLHSLWRCVRSWFQAEHHMHWLRQGRVEVLDQAILFEDAQMRRFDYLYSAEREWADLIATICYHPFRRPAIDAYQRIREPDLGLTSAYQVVEGYTTEPRLEGITSSVASELIRPGWLSATFHSALTYAKEEHDLRTRGGSFQPDEDASSATDRVGPRRALVDATVSGRARQRREIEVLSRIHSAIRTGIGFKQNPMEADQPIEDRLFTSWTERLMPSQFLGEPIVGAPSNFNREFIPVDALPTRQASVAKQEVVLPQPPTIEEIMEGVGIEFPPLVFSAWSIETAPSISTKDLKFFAKEVSPAELDLDVAQTRWIPPPDECLGTISVRSPEDRSAWVLDEARLADIGSLITSNPHTRPASGRGPYRFIIQQDGEPMAHPAGIPIKFAVRSDVAPPGAEDMVVQALQAVSDRTGHEFAFDGTFTGVPNHGPDRLEIGWAFNEEFQEWEVANGKTPGTAIAWGGPTSTNSSTGQRILSGGFVLLNADMDCSVGFTPGASHGTVLLHELGHAMNLGHVNDEREIMRPHGFKAQTVLDYGPGDTQGFQVLRDSALRMMADARFG
jgi:hypothetical protein